MNLPVLGLAGVAGAGKDTVFERLVALHGERFIRRSVADPLKESVAALFALDLDTVERLKRDPKGYIEVGDELGPGRWFTMREILQRFGTEVGRNIYGDDFWLDQWTRFVQEHAKKSAMRRVGPYTYVNTSVRFENEARRILEMGGEVWHIEGPQDEGASGHESEVRLPDALITRVIDNSVREGSEFRVDCGGPVRFEPDYSHLDDQIAGLLG